MPGLKRFGDKYVAGLWRQSSKMLLALVQLEQNNLPQYVLMEIHEIACERIEVSTDPDHVELQLNTRALI